MAEGDSVKSPQSINAEESADMTKVTVKLIIPSLAMKKSLFGHPRPKPGVSDVDVKFDTQSLEVNASVTIKGKTTKYHYKVNKLPGVIHPDKCTIESKVRWSNCCKNPGLTFLDQISKYLSTNRTVTFCAEEIANYAKDTQLWNLSIAGHKLPAR